MSLLLGACPTASAWDDYNTHYASCLEQECCKDTLYRLSGELLFFRPSMEQSAFVITSTENVVGGEFFPSGERHFNRIPFKIGFRVGASLLFCEDSSLDARITFHDAAARRSIPGDFLFDTYGFPGDGAQAPEDTSYEGIANVQDRFKYCSVDLAYTRSVLTSCMDSLDLIFGLHYARIDHTTNFTSEGFFRDSGGLLPVANAMKSHSDFHGIGPELGLDYTYAVTNGFGLNMNSRGAILCSHVESDFHYATLRTAGTAGANLTNDGIWRVTPSFDTRLAGVFRFCCLAVNAEIQFGYEWVWYGDAVNSIRGIDVAFAGDSIDDYSNFSLHGPFLRLGIVF